MPMVFLPKYRASRPGANRRAGQALVGRVTGLAETGIGCFRAFLASWDLRDLEKIYSQKKQTFKNKFVFTLIKDRIN